MKLKAGDRVWGIISAEGNICGMHHIYEAARLIAADWTKSGHPGAPFKARRLDIAGGKS